MRIFRRNGFWIRILCVQLIVITGCGPKLDCPVSKIKTELFKNNGTNSSIADPNLIDTHCSQVPRKDMPTCLLWHELWELPETIFEESKEIATEDDYLWPLILAGGASIAMHNSNADKEIAENFNLHRSLGTEVDKGVDFIGGPGFHFAAAGAWYLISADNNDLVNNYRSWTMLKALSTTGAITLGLKLLRDNDTPNGKWLAWPSGHTSSSFTVASVLDEIYGPEVGIPAYLGAGFVGYRMMDSGDHWASDVVFGAVLGWIVGHHIGKKHKDPQIAGFDIVPFTAIDGQRQFAGISMIKQF